jgi:hypothetical protein
LPPRQQRTISEFIISLDELFHLHWPAFDAGFFYFQVVPK